MDYIICQILEFCGNDKKEVQKVIDTLQDLCDRTNEYFEE